MSSTQLLPADDSNLALALELLEQGQVVAFPTETVYGLGADATNPDAVARIYAAKGRPAKNPLIVHVPDLEAATAFAHVTDIARAVAARFWPGPVTMILRLVDEPGLVRTVTAGLPTVAVRAPAHPTAQTLLRRFGRPLVAPSANPSGRLSPTRARHVAQSLDGRIPLVLDGGPAAVGLESTILDLTGPSPVMLRPGGITRARLSAVLGDLTVSDGSPDQPTAPGQLLRHYSPRTPIRLEATDCSPDEAWLGFGPGATPAAVAALNLSAAGDLLTAASNLFDMLHTLDEAGASAIAVAPIPSDGIGLAINERLRRAASGD